MGIPIHALVHVVETVLGCERLKKGDHVRYVLRVNGRVVGKLKFSHSWRGNEQIRDEILHLQAQSMNCSLQTWKLLLQGRITKKTYFKELLDKGLINQEEFEKLCK